LKHIENNKTDIILSSTPFDRVFLTDWYNQATQSSEIPQNLVYEQIAVSKLVAIGQLGISGRGFGLLVHAEQTSTSIIEVSFGGANSVVLDNTINGNVNLSLHNKPFTSIRQTNSEGFYTYIKFKYA
jgi:hypothetical protein